MTKSRAQLNLDEARRVYARALLNRALAGEQDSTADIASEAIVIVMENRLIDARIAYDLASDA